MHDYLLSLFDLAIKIVMNNLKSMYILYIFSNDIFDFLSITHLFCFYHVFNQTFQLHKYSLDPNDFVNGFLWDICAANVLLPFRLGYEIFRKVDIIHSFLDWIRTAEQVLNLISENFVFLNINKLKNLAFFNSIINNRLEIIVKFIEFLFLKQHFKLINKIIWVLFDTFDSPIYNVIIHIFTIESLILIVDPHKYNF